MFFLGDIPNLKMAARQKPRNKSGKCVKFIVGHTDTVAIFHVTNLLPMYVSPAIGGHGSSESVTNVLLA